METISYEEYKKNCKLLKEELYSTLKAINAYADELNGWKDGRVRPRDPSKKRILDSFKRKSDVFDFKCECCKRSH